MPGEHPCPRSSPAPPACCSTRPRLPGPTASATSARPPTRGSTRSPAPGRRGGRSCRSARPGYGDSPYQSFSAFAGNPLPAQPGDCSPRDGLLRRRRAGRPALPGGARRLRPRHRVQGRRCCARAWDDFRGGPAGAPAGGVRRVLRPRGGVAGRLRPVHGAQGRPTAGSAGTTGRRTCSAASRPPWTAARRELADGDRAAPASGSSCSAGSGAALKQYARDAEGEADRRRADLRRPATRPTCGPTRPVPAGRGPPADGGGRGAAGLLLRRPASCGATRTTTGSAMKQAATPGGSRGCGRRSSRWIWCGSTTSAGSRPAWEIPAGKPTAEIGEWVPAPGAELFDALADGAGRPAAHRRRPGRHHAEVDALRDEFGLPGMRVLQFAFGGAGRPLPAAPLRAEHAWCYTGTHDNDTTRRLVRGGAGSREAVPAPLPGLRRRRRRRVDLIRAGVAERGRRTRWCRCRTC